MKSRRWTPLTLLQSFLGAALLFIGVVAVVAGLGFLFDPSATVPHHGTRTNDPWLKAVFPAIGLVTTCLGALLFLGYPHRRPRDEANQTAPTPGHS
jgi:hypothetical protein